MSALKKMFVFLTFAFVFAALINTANAATIKDTKSNNQPRFIGTWQLNRAISDSKLNKVRFNPGKLPAPVPVAPESLTLAADDELSEITINEGFEKVIHTQTLKFNNESNEAAGKAYWKNGKLIVESNFGNGSKITRIFELAANRKTLKVTFRIDEAGMAKALIIQRVYNRVAEATDNPGVEEKASVNIAQVGL